MKNNIVSFCFILLFLACNSKENNQFNSISEISKKYQIPENTKYYLFIPLSGCGSCIDPAIKFVNENFNLKNIAIIAVTYSIKEFKMRFPAYQNNRNLICDTAQLSLQYNLLQTAPELYEIENNTIRNHYILDAQNSKEILKKLK